MRARALYINVAPFLPEVLAFARMTIYLSVFII